MKRIGLVVAYDGTTTAAGRLSQMELPCREFSMILFPSFLGKRLRPSGPAVRMRECMLLAMWLLFDTNTRIPGEKISYALNQRLPEDIRIQMSEEVELISIRDTVTVRKLMNTVF